MQSGVADSLNDHNNTQKVLMKIDTVINFLLFRMKYTIDGGYLFDD